MDTDTYPGKGLSLSQLLFALSKELERVSRSSLPTEETVSKLDREASFALATIHEWRNSFALINKRIPLDVLTLIPTYFTSQRDLFYTASVCRHWRRAFLKNGTLWGRLDLGRDEECIATLLKRAKGSPLDVTINSAPPATKALISPRAHQIRSLYFSDRWKHIVAFSKFNSGQFPLLRTLKIRASRPNPLPALQTPIFGSCINLEHFIFSSDSFRHLCYFAFPNLTTLKATAWLSGEHSVVPLFAFLGALPKLQSVEILIAPRVTLGDIPQEMVLVLPNIRTFSLLTREDDTAAVYSVAAHISCPNANCTTLTHQANDRRITSQFEAFPIHNPWSSRFRQYSGSPAEEIVLEMGPGWGKKNYLSCSLTFRSFDSTSIRLVFEIFRIGEDLPMPFEEMGQQTFHQAFEAIEQYPLLHKVKRLHIKVEPTIPDIHRVPLPADDTLRRVFNLLGPLDELVIRGCELKESLPKVLSREIRELKILNPCMGGCASEHCMEALVDLAESQHNRGIPFERVEIRTSRLPEDLYGMLEPWVDGVDCFEEQYSESGN